MDEYNAQQQAENICDNLEIGQSAVDYIKEKLEIAFASGELKQMDVSIKRLKEMGNV